MTTFAVLINDVVENIIVADSLEIAETVTGKTCVEYSESNLAQIGWTWDGTTFAAPTFPTE